MADKNGATENHPAEPTSAPSMKKGSFDQIGAYAPLKDTASSPNSKSGEPFGNGGQ